MEVSDEANESIGEWAVHPAQIDSRLLRSRFPMININ